MITKALTAFFGALAGVLFAACCNTTLQADSLTTAAGGQCDARQWLQGGCEFAVGFGNDLIAHQWLQEKKFKAILSHRFEATQAKASKLAFNRSCLPEPD
jgi:hypothetical protein